MTTDVGGRKDAAAAVVGTIDDDSVEDVPTAGPGVPTDGVRPLRADAQRNRLRVLQAAESVFAAEGISVPVDVIAEKAGVGVGTLYRHFPTKEKLFEAILMSRVVELTADARARLTAEDPGAAFFGFLQHVVAESALKRDLIQALAGAGIEPDQVVVETKAALEAAVTELLERAQRAGAVRADITSTVVLSLVGATCMAADQAAIGATPAAMLTIICDGLRTS
jgi:AcrR family transcriptional regulator